ncbi:MAG: Hsp33 family molecular chaperone HslO [Novosphingobium sp.]|nr:Hsp33 family molecular chaperone HslO [Novosphingobium sp.]
MSSDTQDSPTETGFDRVLAFSLPERNVRGRLVRLGPVLETVLSKHAYTESIGNLLSEALVMTCLMGSLLKEFDSQITLQVHAEGGVVDLLVCDFRKGELRGYVRHDPERLDGMGANPCLATLFGEGHLAITFELIETNERYQGIVLLEGSGLSQACESYFTRSEQVPTLLRVGVRTEGDRRVASGLIVQHFPEGEEGKTRLAAKPDHPDWEDIVALAGSIRHDELVDTSLSLEQLVWRLFHEESEVRVERMAALSQGCRCTIEHFQQVLVRFSENELLSMRDEVGRIPVECAFCSRTFRIEA